MKIFIPPLGTLLRLTERWTFELENERRNKSILQILDVSLIKYFKKNSYGFGDDGPPPLPVLVFFPAGTILSTDRIYIRRNAKEFDSVTFWIKYCPGKINNVEIPFKKGKNVARFFAKLEDCNRIVADVLPEGSDIYKDHIK